jgi:hypothetical protein
MAKILLLLVEEIREIIFIIYCSQPVIVCIKSIFTHLNNKIFFPKLSRKRIFQESLHFID